jgi:DNA damage-inducible protein 1
MRLLDTRFSGMARGVGTAKILGRIHSAQIRLGDLHLPVSFSVLEVRVSDDNACNYMMTKRWTLQGRDVDLLFGLDMLKRHQACIDLEKNVLRIQGREVRFLAEHELPNKARQVEELAEELDQASATGNLPLAPKTPAAGSTFSGAGQKLGGPSASTSTPTPSTTVASGSASQYPESSIEAVSRLVSVIATRNCPADSRSIVIAICRS